MRKVFSTILIAACAVLAFNACTATDPDENLAGTPYGFWVVDQLTVETEAVVNGTANKVTSNTDYSDVYGRLYLDKSNLAQVWCNLFHTDIETFTYDATTKRITFKESLDASDDGKAIVFLGIYDVTLSGDKMILSQPEASIGNDQYALKERAIYTLHRVPVSEKPETTEDD